MFKMRIDLSEKGLRDNLYYCACWLIGGYENALSDYSEDSEEFKEAKEWLSDRAMMVRDIMQEGCINIYKEGFSGTPSNDALLRAYMKYPSSLVKMWTEEAINRIL